MGEEITKTKAHDFFSRINELVSLHNLVQKPRDQIAVAEALLNITKSLLSSLESSLNQGNLQISDFLSGLLEKYVEDNTTSHECRCISSMCIGINVSHVFPKAPGMQTMLGPMDNRISHKKLVRKRARPVEISHPEEVNNVGSMDRITSEENVAKMFDVLKKQRLVILEELVLNRTSFSKTIENIFSLSFLVKDGRAKIGIDDNGAFFISPRNAPAAMAVANGEVKFHHFVLRFDYNDWKLMINNVNNEEGATQHTSRVEGIMHEPAALMTPPIKKLSRNRGLVILEE